LTFRLEIKRDHIIVVLGKRGSGKTTVIRFLVREADFAKTIIYNGNLDDDYLQERDFPGSDNIKVVRRRFTDPAWDNFNAEESFKDQFVVIDECDLVNNNHPDFYKEWVNVGRHANSGGVAAARRPTMLPRDITANADVTIIFRAKERSVRDFIKASYTDVVASEAEWLKKYEFIIVNSSQDPVAKARLTPDGKRLEVLHTYPEDFTPAPQRPQSPQHEPVPRPPGDRRRSYPAER
jgi:hypothetical protein